MATFADRVQETTTTTGTGTLTLAGAVAGYRAFSVVGNGATVYYTITDTSNNWEVGQGTYTSAGTTLSRTTILASSNSNAAVSFAAGTKTVFLDLPAAFLGNVLLADAAKLTGDLDVNGHAIKPTAGQPIVLSTSGDLNGVTIGDQVTNTGTVSGHTYHEIHKIAGLNFNVYRSLIEISPRTDSPTDSTTRSMYVSGMQDFTISSGSNTIINGLNLYVNSSVSMGPDGNQLQLDPSGNIIFAGSTVQVYSSLSMNSHQINDLTDPSLAQDAATKHYVDTRGFLTSITSGQVTGALGFTPYNATNPSGFLSSINSGQVTTALGFTPYNATNPSAYISANQTITLSGDVSGSGTTAITATLPTVNSNVGTFTAVSVNSKGLVTAAANQTLTGDITGTASGTSIVTTLPASGVSAGTYNHVTVTAKGIVTGGTNAPAVGSINVSGSSTVITPGTNEVVNVTMSANTTFTIWTIGAVDGQRVTLRLTQDATGSRTVAFDSTVGFGTDITSFTATTTASKTDIVGLQYNSAAGKWQFVAYARGY